MSQGTCYCPCGQWNHDGALCTGRAEAAMPTRHALEGNLAVPVCNACRHAIAELDDSGVITPPDQR